MISLKDKIVACKSQIKEMERSSDAQNAQLNRMEGGISHARGKYEDRYGEFVRGEITDPKAYILNHRQQMSEIKKQMLANEQNIKKLENDTKPFFLWKRIWNELSEMPGWLFPKMLCQKMRYGIK